MRRLLKVFSIAVACFATGLAGAAYPDRPITLIVQFGPGGGTDLAARAIASRVEKILGQPIVVVNRPGAGGTIGVAAIASAKPDGYTIGMMSMTNLTIAPHVMDVSYKIDDFEFIAGIAQYIYGTSVPVSSPFKTLNDLVDYAKKNPGKINYGVQGLSTTNNFGMVQLMKAAGIKMTAITFKDTVGEVTAALGGHIDVTNQDPPVVVPQIQGGKLRLLASFGEERWRWVPDVPTAKELGYNFSVTSLLGVAAPKGVPTEIITKLREAFKAAADNPEFEQAVEKIYLAKGYRNHIQWRQTAEAGLKANEAMIRELGMHKSQQAAK